jgi:hypothetical protein
MMPEPDKPKEDDDCKDDVVIAPPSVDFVADTASVSPDGATFPFPINPQSSFLYSERRFEASLSLIPMPSAEQLERLVKLRASAADDIFEEYRAQGAHRRALEKSVIDTKNSLAMRGQMIGGGLGAIGLVGSLFVTGLGQGWAGFGIAIGSLGGLVSIFVLGQSEQRKNLQKNTKIRSDMAGRKSIEEVDADRAAPKKTPKVAANRQETK